MTVADPRAGWTRAELSALVREYLLIGHLVDRAGMPHLIGPYGRDGMAAIAVDEWMGASPVYTRRMQRALGFVGDDVVTVFKGMQLDIGAPPEFMDFRYTVHDADHGEFELAHCGALADVEPMGEDFVVAMCHHIEDPTFDATALATHPGAQVRPVHRPPRVPADRHPHCHWTVAIDRSVGPQPDPDVTVRMAGTLAATVELATGAPEPGDDGRRDYAGALEADLDLGAFDRPTLLRLADEVALQAHLLTMSFLAAVADRHGIGAARDVGVRQLTGLAGVAADRLARLLGAPADLDGVAAVLAVHPVLRPAAYVSCAVEREASGLRVVLGPCAALDETDVLGWPRLLAEGADAALGALVRAVDDRAVVARAATSGDEAAAWTVTRGDEAQPESADVVLTRFSTGADFVFRR